MTVPMIKSIGDVPYPIDTHSDAFSPLLTAGAALGITGEATDSAAWLQRVSTSDGPTAIRSIHGRTLRWNQLVSRPYYSESTATAQDVSFSVADGYVTAEGTASASGSWSFMLNKSASIVAGHKMLVSGIDAISNVDLRVYSSDTSTTHLVKDTAAPQIFTIGTTSTKMSVYLMFSANQAVSFKGKPQLFDLTAMFGAGSEPSTIEEFTALYPLPYYEYDAGSLLPVNITGIETTGFNQWDEEWEVGSLDANGNKVNTVTTAIRSKNKIPCFPSTLYYMEKPSNTTVSRVCFYDASGAHISGKDIGIAESGHAVTTPEGAYYLMFTLGAVYGTTYNHDICINLSDPTRNGTYEPHWHQERIIPASTYFPQGMRGAGTVYDELTQTQAITRIGERAYQSGDESDPTVVTDGTVTHYALATPTTVEIDPQLNLTYRTEQGGTERVMVPTGEQSAPPTIVTAQGYTAESLRDAALATIAPVENGLASTNYALGSYLVHGGKLCRVTTAIATGEAITIGTNVTATTVMAEVIALIAQ